MYLDHDKLFPLIKLDSFLPNTIARYKITRIRSLNAAEALCVTRSGGISMLCRVFLFPRRFCLVALQ